MASTEAKAATPKQAGPPQAVDVKALAKWVKTHWTADKPGTTQLSESEQQAKVLEELTRHNDGAFGVLTTGRIRVGKHEIICRESAVTAYFQGKHFNLKLKRKAKRKERDAAAKAVMSDGDAPAAAAAVAAGTADKVAKKPAAPAVPGTKRKQADSKSTSSDSDSDSDSDSGSNSDSSDSGEGAGSKQPSSKKHASAAAASAAKAKAKPRNPTEFDDEDDLAEERAEVAEEIKERKDKHEAEQAKKRYILFVGNLPYEYGVEEIKKLFSKANVIGVRIPTNKSESPIAPSPGPPVLFRHPPSLCPHLTPPPVPLPRCSDQAATGVRLRRVRGRAGHQLRPRLPQGRSCPIHTPTPQPLRRDAERL